MMRLAILPSAILRLALLCAGAFALVAPAAARELLPGPVPAEVLAVVDGDTLKVRARIWLGQSVEVSVRLDGVDAPELRGACDSERRLAEQVRDYLARRLAGAAVHLRDITQDKYGGRVLARLTDAAGNDLGRDLIAAGLARRYDGGKRGPWC